jgi:hypothetical protein
MIDVSNCYVCHFNCGALRVTFRVFALLRVFALSLLYI